VPALWQRAGQAANRGVGRVRIRPPCYVLRCCANPIVARDIISRSSGRRRRAGKKATSTTRRPLSQTNVVAVHVFNIRKVEGGRRAREEGRGGLNMWSLRTEDFEMDPPAVATAARARVYKFFRVSRHPQCMLAPRVKPNGRLRVYCHCVATDAPCGVCLDRTCT
jgi:hypothetical protein